MGTGVGKSGQEDVEGRSRWQDDAQESMLT